MTTTPDTRTPEQIERVAIALYEAERADSPVGQHWISWEKLIEKDREHPERAEKYGAEKYRRHARAAFVTGPSQPPSWDELQDALYGLIPVNVQGEKAFELSSEMVQVIKSHCACTGRPKLEHEELIAEASIDIRPKTFGPDGWSDYGVSAWDLISRLRAALTAAAGVAPQEVQESTEIDISSERSSTSDREPLTNAEIIERIAEREREAAGAPAPQELACGRFDTSHGSCTRSLDHDGPCAPSPDREKLIAELHDVKRVLRSSGQSRLADAVEQALDALAAQPVKLDPEKVAEVLRRANYWSARAVDVARALCEAAKRGELT